MLRWTLADIFLCKPLARLLFIGIHSSWDVGTERCWAAGQFALWVLWYIPRDFIPSLWKAPVPAAGVAQQFCLYLSSPTGAVSYSGAKLWTFIPCFISVNLSVTSASPVHSLSQCLSSGSCCSKVHFWLGGRGSKGEESPVKHCHLSSLLELINIYFWGHRYWEFLKNIIYKARFIRKNMQT